jgi:N-acetylmuramoyl-L-alanine amidase
MLTRWLLLPVLAGFSLFSTGCALLHPPGQYEPRKGDEIMVAGKMFHTGTKVVLWLDPGGYDAYRVERRFGPIEQSDWESSKAHMDSPRTPNRYSVRDVDLTDAELEKVRGGGWDLPLLQSNVDQFVIHFDVAGVSRNCFKTLQDVRDLSVHFMLDLDGTLYQTLDLKERARQATIANGRSVGIEVANIGSYSAKEKDPLSSWYAKDAAGHTVITIPKSIGTNVERVADFHGRPARKDPVYGMVQGKMLHQYDYTPEQYHALAKLTATLCTIFPKLTCDYPREKDGTLMTHKIPSDEYKNYHGVLGHYHVQTNKVDPGPAMQWDYVIGEARRIMKLHPQADVHGATHLYHTKLISNN